MTRPLDRDLGEICLTWGMSNSKRTLPHTWEKTNGCAFYTSWSGFNMPTLNKAYCIVLTEKLTLICSTFGGFLCRLSMNIRIGVNLGILHWHNCQLNPPLEGNTPYRVLSPHMSSSPQDPQTKCFTPMTQKLPNDAEQACF